MQAFAQYLIAQLFGNIVILDAHFFSNKNLILCACEYHLNLHLRSFDWSFEADEKISAITTMPMMPANMAPPMPSTFTSAPILFE